MKHIGIITTTLASLLIVGCTSVPKPEPETLTDFEKATKLKSAKVYDAQFSENQLSVQYYQNALSSLSGDGDGAQVEVYVVNIAKPVVSMIPPSPYHSSALTVWKIRGAGSHMFINSTEYRNTSGFAGGTRMRRSVEGALRDNIAEGLRVCSLPSGAQATECSKSLVVLVHENKKIFEMALTNLDTKKIHHLFRANGFFCASLPPGNYEFSRIVKPAIGWGLKRTSPELEFSIDAGCANLLVADMLVSESDEITALATSLVKIDPSLALRKIQLKPAK